MGFYNKYLKYKLKYFQLKKLIGGNLFPEIEQIIIDHFKGKTTYNDQDYKELYNLIKGMTGYNSCDYTTFYTKKVESLTYEHIEDVKQLIKNEIRSIKDDKYFIESNTIFRKIRETYKYLPRSIYDSLYVEIVNKTREQKDKIRNDLQKRVNDETQKKADEAQKKADDASKIAIQLINKEKEQQKLKQEKKIEKQQIEKQQIEQKRRSSLAAEDISETIQTEPIIFCEDKDDDPRVQLAIVAEIEQMNARKNEKINQLQETFRQSVTFKKDHTLKSIFADKTESFNVLNPPIKQQTSIDELKFFEILSRIIYRIDNLLRQSTQYNRHIRFTESDIYIEFMTDEQMDFYFTVHNEKSQASCSSLHLYVIDNKNNSKTCYPLFFDGLYYFEKETIDKIPIIEYFLEIINNSELHPSKRDIYDKAI